LLGFTCSAAFAFLVLPLAARGGFEELSGSSAYRTWQVLIVVQASLWFSGAVYSIGIWRRTPTERALPASAWAAIVVLGLLIVLPMVAYQVGSTAYDGVSSKPQVVARFPFAPLLGLLGSGILGAGIIRLHVLANDWFAGRVNFVERLDSYRKVSSFLETHLMLLGGILAGGVIGSQASRKAIMAIEGVSPFPAEQVWQLAVYWSALLAVVYISSRSAVRRIGLRLRDELLAESGADLDVSKRLEREGELGKLLALNRGYLAELQSVFGVLTPIAGAIASQLIK